MNLSELGQSGVGSIGVELDDDSIQWSPTTSTSKSPAYKRIYLSNINMTANLTEVINIEIPEGKKAILLAASINTSTESSSKIQLELDGVLRINETSQLQQAGYAIALLGLGVNNAHNFLNASDGLGFPTNVSNIVFKKRLIIRASNPSALYGSVSVSYILVKG